MEHDKLWTPEIIGRRPQRDDPLCSSGTVQGDFVTKVRAGNNVAKGVPRKRTPWNIRQVDPKGSMGIKDLSPRRQFCLRNEKTPGRISGKNFRLQTVKRFARSCVEIQTNKNWTLGRG
jgi:hypothetical protein